MTRKLNLKTVIVSTKGTQKMKMSKELKQRKLIATKKQRKRLNAIFIYALMFLVGALIGTQF